jgi:hypothetical protein
MYWFSTLRQLEVVVYDPKLQEILDSAGFAHKLVMKVYIRAIQDRLLDGEDIVYAYPSNVGFYALTDRRILFYAKKSGIVDMPLSSILGLEERDGKIIIKSSVDKIYIHVGQKGYFRMDYKAPRTLSKLIRKRMN